MDISEAKRADFNAQARVYRPTVYSAREVAEMALEADLHSARADHGPEFALAQASFDVARDMHRELQRGFVPSRQVWLWRAPRGARTPRARRVRVAASASAGGGSSGRPSRSADDPPGPLGASFFQLAGVTL